MKNKKDKIENTSSLPEVLTLSKKILKLLYFLMIAGIIFLVVLIVKEAGLLEFILTLLKVMSPLFIGFIVAWLLNPIVTRLKKKGIPRVWGSIIVYVVFILVIYVFISVLVPTVYKQLNDLIGSLPNIINGVKDFISSIFDKFKDVGGIDIENIQNNLFNTIQNVFVDGINNLPNSIVSFAGSFISGLGTFVIGLIVGLYMLFNFNNIESQFLKIIPNKHKYEIKELLSNIGLELRKCVNGTLFVAFIVFISCFLGFAIVGLDAPLLFGLFCGITDLIPYIGPYIGGAAAVIVGFSQSTTIGIIVLIIIIVVQTLESYVLQPVVMSKAVKLHPVTIIIGLLIFNHFFGIIGMILATPTISLLKILYRFIVKKFNLFNYNDSVTIDE